MIRRPPTVIALNDEELQCHLQRAFLRTLPADFNQLHLEDRGQSDDGHAFASSLSEDSGASSDSNGEVDFTTMPDSTGGSSCIGHDSSPGGMRSLTARNAFLVAAMTASLHQPPEPNRSPATRNQISTLFPQYRTWRSRESLGAKTALKTPQRELKLYSMGPQEMKKPENCRHAEAEALGYDARHSASQEFRLSPDSCSELTISSVPLRGLSLASTESYEAALADTASPSVALDAIWKFGTVEPDSIFEESGADRGAA
ncbi:NADP-dependent alcohol dehydrogenase 6 [Penicillium atrosanguineum]|uniref:Uncharacterized protein n=1 Tax=Penicillium atrosanguineum TaxID=1132637 RepID=A0A9W9U1X1_9EURO|nr:NADP-dependent alcohol dehydrogenase 6 [Penicillium atrosanguineum]KAJ5290178.1 NADP-dependent alcohol dehydrogenase 6 [Penicillium atrosanguineum]KAJ5308002.1 hypothetical protein N7476_008658 [Penicillium atrosanguineum]